MGDWGEDRACDFLVRHGFEIIEKNYFCRYGEIDIVARKKGDFYFVEVKTRKQKAWANTTTFTSQQKKRLIRAVKHYCFNHQIADVAMILAGLVVAIDQTAKKLKFHFSIMDW